MTDIHISVRDLVQFCFRRGDIDHRFSPSPSAAQGIEGHQRVYRRRGPDYQREYAVAYRYEHAGQALLLRGRADGYDAQVGLVEEIKTCRVPFAEIPAAISETHLAQASLYAAMIALAESCTELRVRLTWFNIDSGAEHQQEQLYEAATLRTILEEALQAFARWSQRLAQLRAARDSSLQELGFPLGDFRAGQRQIAELVYKCVDQAGHLLLEAPTGIGKTAAVLYPALKALATGKHDALVFVTARTVGRRAAQDTLALFRAAGLELSALSLTAKEGICLAQGKSCHADDCPYAAGYYDRLPDALHEALAQPTLDRDTLLALARSHTVCPYQLGLDLLPWVDVVIADLHYLYSLTALLMAQAERDGRRWSALLDEAHNLPDRARSMYRAELARAELLAAKRRAPKALVKPLERLNRRLLALQKDEWLEPDFDARELPPDKLMQDLQALLAAIGDYQAQEPLGLQRQPRLLEFYFALLQFQRVAEQWGADFSFELHRGEGRQGLRLVLNCLDPERLLAQRQARLHAVIAFSATLSPAPWCRRSLGLAADTVCSRQASPFSASQLQVSLATAVDTRYRQRQQSLPQLAQTLARWLKEVPGNCILYFPSFNYMRSVVECLCRQDAFAGRSLWQQQAQAPQHSREALLTLLEERRDVVACCILGGVFGEGVDLPGERLNSVVVVGVGLPQVNRDTERLRLWHSEQGRDGFAHAFLYPAMQKVDQALGRVVRRPEDRGRALLVDTRYAWASYRALLPPWWDYRPWE